MYNPDMKRAVYRCPYDWTHLCEMVAGCGECDKRIKFDAKKKDKSRDCLKGGKSGKHKADHLARIRVCSKCGKIVEKLADSGYWTDEVFDDKKN